VDSVRVQFALTKGYVGVEMERMRIDGRRN
jgi:hypothetical protein